MAHLGHWLTCVARGAYEIQAPGVTNPVALRELNEIHHRIYAQIRSLVARGERNLDSETLASWLTAEGCGPELRASCFGAFEKALSHVRGNPG